MMDNPSRGELGGTASTTLANMTRKSIKMSEHTSTISRHEEEVRWHQEYKQEFGNPDAALQPLNVGNAVDPNGDDPEGPRAFMRALQTL